MFRFISDSEVAFPGQLTSALSISSDFPSKPLLEIVGKNKRNSLLVLTTKIPGFFCIHLSLMTVRRNGLPQALAVSPHCPRALCTSPFSCPKTRLLPTFFPISSSSPGNSFSSFSQYRHHFLKASLLTPHTTSVPVAPYALSVHATMYLILHSTKQDFN